MLTEKKIFSDINLINLINLLIALIPFTIILGNLAININIILICIFGITLYKLQIFKVDKKLYQYLIYSFFLYLILITLITNINLIINFVPKIAGLYFNVTKDLYVENIIKSFMFLRFLILFLVINKLFEKNNFNLKFFYISCSFFVFLISLDIIIQSVFGKNLLGNPIVYNRPTSFFGNEYIAGGYIQKFSLFFMFLFVSYVNENKKNFYFFILSISFLIPIILTVNRMPMLMYISSIFLIFFLRKQFKSILIFLLIVLLVFFSILKFYPKTRMGMNLKKFHESSFQILNTVIDFSTKEPKKDVLLDDDVYGPSLPKLFTDKVVYNLDREGYILHFNSALQIWQTNKIFGFGIKSFRFNCTYGVGQTCATHPHNYYLEILLDTGVVGLTLILLILVYSIFNFFNFYRYSSSANLKFFSIPFFIVFILEFLPLRSSGSFFTTNNAAIIFLMLAVIVGISSYKKS
jgi:hypothetical protein